MKKKIIIVVAIIIAILATLIGYQFIRNSKEKDLLKQEIANLTSKNLQTGDFTIEVKTKGDYAYIEESIKKYYKELSDNIKEVNQVMTNEALINVLATTNLENDDENLSSSYNTIQNAKTKMNELLSNIMELCTEEKILSLIDKDKVDNYYYDLYKELMYKEDLELARTQVETIDETLEKFLDKVLEMLDFLKENRKHWFIEEGKLYFETDEYVTTYNKLYSELQTLSQEIQKLNWSL